MAGEVAGMEGRAGGGGYSTPAFPPLGLFLFFFFSFCVCVWGGGGGLIEPQRYHHPDTGCQIRFTVLQFLVFLRAGIIRAGQKTRETSHRRVGQGRGINLLERLVGLPFAPARAQRPDGARRIFSHQQMETTCQTSLRISTILSCSSVSSIPHLINRLQRTDADIKCRDRIGRAHGMTVLASFDSIPPASSTS